MNAILGFSSLLRNESGISDEKCKTLDIINHSGEHLLNLIKVVLDMVFGENPSRIRKNHAPENLAVIRQMVVNLLKKEKAAKGDIQAK